MISKIILGTIIGFFYSSVLRDNNRDIQLSNETISFIIFSQNVIFVMWMIWVAFTFMKYPIIYGFLAIVEFIIGIQLYRILNLAPDTRALMAMLALPIVAIALIIL